jgi:hypothetical protein
MEYRRTVYSESSNRLPEFPTPAEYAAYTRAALEEARKKQEAETNRHYGYQRPPNQHSVHARPRGNLVSVSTEPWDSPWPSRNDVRNLSPRRQPFPPPSPDQSSLSTRNISYAAESDVEKANTDLTRRTESLDSVSTRSSLSDQSPPRTERFGSEENQSRAQEDNLTSITLESMGEIFEAEAKIQVQDQAQIKKLLNDLGATKLDFRVAILTWLHLKYPDLVQRAKFRLQTTSARDQTNQWATGNDKTIVCDGWIDFGGYSDVYQV